MFIHTEIYSQENRTGQLKELKSRTYKEQQHLSKQKLVAQFEECKNTSNNDCLKYKTRQHRAEQVRKKMRI